MYVFILFSRFLDKSTAKKTDDMRRHIMLDKNRVVKPLKFLCCATGKKKSKKKEKRNGYIKA